MALVATAIANGGKLLEPKILKELKNKNQPLKEFSPTVKETININPNNLQVVREGMGLAAEIGTAQAMAGLAVKVAGKTGTAEIGTTKSAVNSWFMGFLPFENPKIAMAVVLESGSSKNLIGAPAASRQIVEWIIENRPELLR